MADPLRLRGRAEEGLIAPTRSLTRDAPLKAFNCDRFTVPLPEWHRFPMIKYARLRERIEASGLIAPADLVIPHAATDDELLLAHDAEYVRKVSAGLLTKDEVRTLGFPWTASLVERSRRSVGASIEAARLAFEDGVAVNLAGGTHHAYRDHGAGFCVFNDAAVAARVILDEGKATRVLIVDCDVHQGDGTASIFANDPTVFTFSIHGAMNYPLQKQSKRSRRRAGRRHPGRGVPGGPLGRARDRDRTVQARPGDLSGRGRSVHLRPPGPAPGLEGRPGRARPPGLRPLPVRGPAGRGVAMAGGYAEDVNDTVDIHYQTVVEAVAIAPGWPNQLRRSITTPKSGGAAHPPCPTGLPPMGATMSRYELLIESIRPTRDRPRESSALPLDRDRRWAPSLHGAPRLRGLGFHDPAQVAPARPDLCGPPLGSHSRPRGSPPGQCHRPRRGERRRWPRGFRQPLRVLSRGHDPGRRRRRADRAVPRRDPRRRAGRIRARHVRDPRRRPGVSS